MRYRKGIEKDSDSEMNKERRIFKRRNETDHITKYCSCERKEP
jgi:hypothetical protein